MELRWMKMRKIAYLIPGVVHAASVRGAGNGRRGTTRALTIAVSTRAVTLLKK